MRGRQLRCVTELGEQAVELVERAEGDRDFARARRARCASRRRISTVAAKASESCLFERSNVARLLTFRAQQRRLPRAASGRAGRRASRPRARSAPWRRSRWPPGSAAHRRAAAARARGPCRCRPPSAAAAPARSGCSRRSRLLAALRERPTACAACSWVRPNSSVRRCRPCASSSGLRSSRWMFSISAIAAAASSGTSRTSTGTLVEPGQAGGADAALAGDDLEAAAGADQATHQDRLHHALRLDALGQLVQRRPRPCACAAGSGRAAAARARSVRGSPSPPAEPASGVVRTVGPSSASRPRPRPLGFFVTIGGLSLIDPAARARRGAQVRACGGMLRSTCRPRRHRHEHPRFRRRPGRHDRPAHPRVPRAAPRRRGAAHRARPAQGQRPSARACSTPPTSPSCACPTPRRARRRRWSRTRPPA